MSYSYDSLEDALLQASYRLPAPVFRRLMARVEEIITLNGDGSALEREIQKQVNEQINGARLFNIKNLRSTVAA